MSTTRRSYQRALDSRNRPVPGVYRRDGKFVAGGSIEGRWQFKTLTAATLTEAKRERESWLAGLREGRIAERNTITFRQLFDRWQDERNIAERTAEHERDLFRWYLSTLADRRVQDVARRDLALILKDMNARYSQWTATAIYRIMRATFDLAVRDDIITRSPVSRLSAADRPSQVNQREIARLDSATLAKLVAAVASDRWRVAVALAALGGLRVGEVRGLQWQDIDFEANTIAVRRSLSRTGEAQPTKTDAGSRVVALFPELRRLLLLWKVASPHAAADDKIVSTASGGAVGERNALRALQAAISKAGIDTGDKRLSFHSLRHSAGSVWLTEYGLAITTVSVMLGHASPEITLRVYGRDPRDQQTIIADVLARAAAASRQKANQAREEQKAPHDHNPPARQTPTVSAPASPRTAPAA
jgi:integrase